MYTPKSTVTIFDTTLRDGEQSPGFSMTMEGKLTMARALAELEVDVLEAGFAAASPGDYNSVHRIASEIKGPRIASLSRLRKPDIDTAARALESADKSRAHVFIGTSPTHREFKLQMEREEIIDAIGEHVTYARKYFDDVEFSAEDAMRTERPFLARALRTAAEAGAKTLNVPDTVGYFTPEETYQLFAYLIEEVMPEDDVVFSSHCHDDLGMAVANSLAAIRAGVRQVECTINGIGERAGNAAMEEVVMALRVRKDSYNVGTNINTTKFFPASQTLQEVTEEGIARNKAIVGRNAFAHEAGIHQHGMLANRHTYEIMKPEDVGQPTSALVLGKHSGRHALDARLKQLGYDISEARMSTIFAAFKTLADECKEVTDEDLHRIILDHGPAEAAETEAVANG